MTFTKPHPFAWLFIIASTLLTTTLGIWQVQRLAWKNDLIAQVQRVQDAPALTALPTAENLMNERYRKITLTGDFLMDFSVFRPMAMEGGKNGFQVFSPLRIDGEPRLVLVNRGFINGRMETVKAVLEKQQSKEVRIEGVLRDPRVRRYFMPENQYDKRIWMYEDLVTLEKETGKPVLPLVIEETTACKDCEMIRSDGRVRLRNDHLGYAITWFSLTIIGLVMFAIYHRKKTND